MCGKRGLVAAAAPEGAQGAHVCAHEAWQHRLHRDRHALASNEPLQRLVYRICHIECVLTFYMCVWQSLMKCALCHGMTLSTMLLKALSSCLGGMQGICGAPSSKTCAHLCASQGICSSLLRRRVRRLKHCDATWYARSGRKSACSKARPQGRPHLATHAHTPSTNTLTP